MKINQIPFLFMIFTLSMQLASCSVATTASTATAIAASSLMPSVTPTPVHPAPITLTATFFSGLTPPPSPEYPKLITPRVTPLPTRLSADVRADLSYMLQTNGDCTLPCFWGIQPNQTHYDELYSVIDKLGGPRFDALQENGRLRVSSHFKFEKEGTIYVALAADLQDDIVKDLEVTLINQLDTGITPDVWSAYNMDKILETYGTPDTVELYFGSPYDALTFAVRIKYENIHTSIMYSGITTESNKYLTSSSAIFCPEEIGVDAVVLHIGSQPFNVEPDGVPLSKATGLDEPAFHKLFTENPSACLTLNQDAMR